MSLHTVGLNLYLLLGVEEDIFTIKTCVMSQCMPVLRQPRRNLKCASFAENGYCLGLATLVGWTPKPVYVCINLMIWFHSHTCLLVRNCNCLVLREHILLVIGTFLWVTVWNILGAWVCWNSVSPRQPLWKHTSNVIC